MTIESLTFFTAIICCCFSFDFLYCSIITINIIINKNTDKSNIIIILKKKHSIQI